MSLHDALRYLVILLALAGFTTGMRAAVLWLQASRVSVKPTWLIDEHSIAPVIPELYQGGWTAGIIECIQLSGKLNEQAAKWTAYAVAVSTLASLVGTLL